MELLQDPAFWLAVGQIILIDILLGGDNAIVIAMACRGLPEHQRRRGILLGTAGAIIIRVALIGVALTLLGIPYLKLVGAVLLMWIGIKLLTDEDDEHEVSASDKLWAAVKTIAEDCGESGLAIEVRDDLTVWSKGRVVESCSRGQQWQVGAILAAALKSVTGVVDHGLFLDLADRALIGTAGGVIELEP